MAYYPSGATARPASPRATTARPSSPRSSAATAPTRTAATTGPSRRGVTWKPQPQHQPVRRAELHLALFPGANGSRKVVDPLKTATYGVRYVIADIIQKTLPIEIRLNWTFTPRLSLQAYLQPYIGTGDYRPIQGIGRRADVPVRCLTGITARPSLWPTAVYTVDPDGPGPARPSLSPIRISASGPCAARSSFAGNTGPDRCFISSGPRGGRTRPFAPTSGFWDDLDQTCPGPRARTSSC